MGSKREILPEKTGFRAPQGLMPYSFLENRRIPIFWGLIRHLACDRFGPEFGSIRQDRCAKELYSAASASCDFGFAAESMKSVMRGKVSERKREPLNTP